jgi:hypothetical protein
MQELRRLIMNAEEPTPQSNRLYDYNGPDTKTCARLVSLLVENKSARLVKLQYTQEGVLESKEVCMCGVYACMVAIVLAMHGRM